MSTIFIGDVHGCAEELAELVQVLNLRSDSKVIFLGDLINRGPDSKGVLKIFDDIGARALLGNHEWGFLNYLKSRQPEKESDFENLAVQLGGGLDKWVEKIRLWPAFIEEEDWIAVHAGLQPGKEACETPIEILTRIRTWDGFGQNLKNPSDPPWYDFYQGSRTVYYGHWAEQGLNIRENTVGLDSGCIWGGALSAFVLPERQLVQVPSRQPRRHQVSHS